MSIRRDLLLRSALLRLPDVAALRAGVTAKTAEMPERRRPVLPRRRPPAAAPAKAGGSG